MKLLFMGTPDYAVPVLDRLLAAGHEVEAVYTRPDRPSGRGRTMGVPPVKGFAQGKGIPVYQPQSLRRATVVEALKKLATSAIVVAAYGRILPPEVLGVPPLGVLNVHPSLLPMYRGPSPVVQAILDGCTTTGVTIMQLDAGMDTGPILGQRRTDILSQETARELQRRLFNLGAELLVSILPDWEAGRITPVPQDNAKATVTRLYAKEDGEMDWSLPAVQLARRIRAFDPWPGCYTYWNGRLVKVLKGEAVQASLLPGTAPGCLVEIDGDGEPLVCVVTGDGMLQLQRVQLEGRRPQGIDEFTRGYRGFVGAMLPS